MTPTFCPLPTLEAALSTRLIERSTRALRLTAEGEVLHARALRILAEVEAAESILTAQTSIPQGLLRISAPVLFGQTFLGQIAAAFVKLYPQARLDIMLSDRRVDLMEDNIEAAIRIGEQPDSSLILRTFAEVDHILVAGPDLAAGAAVQRPDDLADRPCIAHAVDAQARSTWRMMQGLRTAKVEVAPVITVSSMVAVREAALMGAGYAFLPRFLVATDLAEGRLVQALPGWTGPRVPIAIVIPSARFQSARLRAFTALLIQRFKGREVGSPGKDS